MRVRWSLLAVNAYVSFPVFCCRWVRARFASMLCSTMAPQSYTAEKTVYLCNIMCNLYLYDIHIFLSVYDSGSWTYSIRRTTNGRSVISSFFFSSFFVFFSFSSRDKAPATNTHEPVMCLVYCGETTL